MENIFEFDIVKQTLKNRNIDINNINLFSTPDYEKLKFDFFCIPNIGLVSIDFIIEKYLLSPEQINNMKSGLFDINTTKYNATEGNITASCLYKEIAKESDKLCKPLFEENLRQKFEGKFGLKNKLIENFNFNLTSFNDSIYAKLKFQKTIFTIYQFDNSLYNLLANPSMENIPFSFNSPPPVHGKTISLLKNEIMKEVSIPFIVDSQRNLSKIISEWEYLLCKISSYEFLNLPSLKEELKRIDTFLKEKILKLLPDYSFFNQPNEHNIFETFFFKILQYEQKCMNTDIILLNNDLLKNLSSNENNSDFYVNHYKEIGKINITLKQLENYLNDNIDFISQLVYKKNSISKKEKNKLLNQTTIACVKNFLSFYYCTNITNGNDETISLLYIISALQSIIFSIDNKESHVFKYYSYKKEHSSLSSKIKNGFDSRKIYQHFWVNKVKSQIFYNLGIIELFPIFISIYTSIDKIILFLLEYHNLNDILLAHNFLYEIIYPVCSLNASYENVIIDFTNSIFNKTKFMLQITHANIYKLFRLNYNLKDDISQFFHKKIEFCLSNDIPEINSSLEIEFLDVCYTLFYTINFSQKIIYFTNFREISSNENIAILTKLKLESFIENSSNLV